MESHGECGVSGEGNSAEAWRRSAYILHTSCLRMHLKAWKLWTVRVIQSYRGIKTTFIPFLLVRLRSVDRAPVPVPAQYAKILKITLKVIIKAIISYLILSINLSGF